MTRSQRRRESRKRAMQYSHSPGQYWQAPEHMSQPELRKRHTARMTDSFLRELARDTAKAYSPLTVATRSLRSNGSRYPERRTETGSAHPASYTAYTV
jgi:hypothetical protein